MNDPLRDPTQNYTVPPNQPAGMRIPEFVFRQLIGFALGKIRESVDTPTNVVDTLFAMVPDEVRKQIKGWIREHKNIFLDVSWPRESATLPMIVVEPQGEQEDTNNALLGDYAGDMPFGRFGDGTPKASPQYAIPELHTTNIYIGADDDRLTLFLYQIVKFILVSNKDKLTQWYDIHNLSISGQVLSQEDKQLPQHGYFRVMTLSYLCLFDFNGAEEAAKIVALTLDVDAASEGVVITSEVPFPEDATEAAPQLLGPFGLTPFYVDPNQAIEWSGYTVELTDPPSPAGDGWVLNVGYKFPQSGVNAIEVRREEIYDYLTDTWSAAPNSVGVKVDGVSGSNYPTMADLAAALASKGVTVSDFGNVVGTDMIDGASGIGNIATATFTV